VGTFSVSLSGLEMTGHMITRRRAVLTALAAGGLAGCGRTVSPGSGSRAAVAAPPPSAFPTASPAASPAATATPEVPALTRAEVVARYGDLTPQTWGSGGRGSCVTCTPSGGWSR
jgi:hypothetical protein